MALKGINQYFSALIRLTKTKFATLVTSNTDESRELGAFGTVKYDALSGISLLALLAPIQNFFASKCGQLLPTQVYKIS